MRPIRLCFAALLTAAMFSTAPSLAPSFAIAAPPLNDNYLASTSIASSPFSEAIDTSEATTQPDLFNPSAQGQPLGGDGPENTTCNGVSFGKTVWYDLQPKRDGGVEVNTAGFDSVVAVYEWNPQDSMITRMVSCQNTPGATEDVLLDVKAGKAYTFQVGGVGGVGGPLSFKLEYFPDADGDGQLDALDECPTTPGIKRFAGCPPSLRGKVAPSLNFANTANGIRISRFVVDGVPKGAKVVARGGGASQTVKAKRAGRVTLSKLVGRSAAAGSTVQVSITLGHTGTGTYKFGATGVSFKWPVKAGGLGTRVQRCLHVGTGKPERCS
jgi:hypothetical protein